MIRRTAFMVTIALVAFSCQGQVESAGDGLLAIVDDDGDLAVLTPEGEVVHELTDLNGQAVVFQPVWSGPDHVVYVEQRALSGELVVADIDGEEARRLEFVTAPFYVYPRPEGGGSADIVTLRNHVEGGLAAEVIHADATVTGLDGDFPFFFTWTGDGRVVAHAEDAYLDEVYPDRRPVAEAVGPFGAPGSRGDDLIFVRSDLSRSFVSVLADGELHDLGSVRGPTHFVVGGDRVAVRSLGGQGDGGAVEARAQTIPALPADALVVIGLDDGEIEIVAPGGVIAFFWDPSARRLLYLGVEDESRGELSWHVWEDGTITDYRSFVPDRSWFANFLPFFDQYAQSMTLWSPDGSAFAYPGIVDDESGVWVQHLDGESPLRLSAGSWVAWGPGG